MSIAPAELVPELAAKRDHLLKVVRGFESCAVAFSGGVDSAVVAKAAQLALGHRAIAVTADSPSVARGELDDARAVARQIGIAHRVITTSEMDNPAYRRNAPDRCYHCKTELYGQLEQLAPQLGVAVIAGGTNLDDQGDYRPGLKAAGEHSVRSPLAECRFTKADVRRLAAHWQLPVSDKPATPCLSSRIAYGEEVTPERLQMIDEAERYLRAAGLMEVRVRYHKGDLARIEVPASEIVRLCDPAFRAPFVAHLKTLGFKYATLDLEGFRTGSMNAVLGSGLLPILG